MKQQQSGQGQQIFDAHGTFATISSDVIEALVSDDFPMGIALVEAYQYTVFWLDVTTLLFAFRGNFLDSLFDRSCQNLCHPYRHSIAYHLIGINDVGTIYLKAIREGLYSSTFAHSQTPVFTIPSLDKRPILMSIINHAWRGWMQGYVVTCSMDSE